MVPTGEFNGRAFYALAVPMIVSRAGLAVMSIADGVMVARWDAGDYAALSLADGIIGRLLDVFVAFLFGALSLVPRYFARGDGRGVRSLWLRTLPVALALGAAGAAAGVFGTGILTALGQAPSLAQRSGPLMLILGAGAPAALLAISAAVYLEGIRRPRIVAVAVIAANLLNIAFNWLLIGGHAGAPAMGALGSAWSTTLVRVGLAAWLVAAAWRTPLPESSMPAANSDSLSDQWRLGISAAATVAVMVSLGTGLTIFAGWLGLLALGAFSASLSLCGPAGLIAFGLADAAGIHVGSAAGRPGVRRPAEVAWASLRLAVLPVAALTVLLVFLAGTWAGLYTHDADLRLAITALLPIAGCLSLVDSVGLVMAASLRGLKEAVWPAAIEIASMLVMIPLAAALVWGTAWVPPQGARGLVLAMLSVAVLRAALLTGRFWWQTRRPLLARTLESSC